MPILIHKCPQKVLLYKLFWGPSCTPSTTHSGYFHVKLTDIQYNAVIR